MARISSLQGPQDPKRGRLRLDWFLGRPYVLLSVLLAVLLFLAGGSPFMIWGIYVRLVFCQHTTLACELWQPSVWVQEFPSRKRVDELSVGSAAGLRWRLAQQPPRFSHLSSLWDEVLGNRPCIRIHPFTSGSRTGLEPPDSARQQAAVRPALAWNHRERSPICKTS